METYGNGLAKYVTAESARLVLENATLRWSRPTLFNDPFDCLTRFQVCPDPQNIRNEILKEFRRGIENEIPAYSVKNPSAKLLNAICTGYAAKHALLEVYEDHFWKYVMDFFKGRQSLEKQVFDSVVKSFNDVKILCLTKNLKSTLMWSHYADNLRGSVLVFSPNSRDSFLTQARPVLYTDDMPFMLDNDILPKYLTGQISMTDEDFIGSIASSIVFTKLSEWSYEVEWRIWAGSGRYSDKEVEYIPFPQEDLIAVVIGVNSEKSFEDDCRRLIIDKGYSKAMLFKAKRSSISSELDYVEA